MDNTTYISYLPEHYNPRPHCCDDLDNELKSWFAGTLRNGNSFTHFYRHYIRPYEVGYAL